MIPRSNNKCDKWVERRKDRLDKQRENYTWDKMSNSNRKELKPIKGLYSQLVSRFSKKELDDLYEVINAGHYWSYINVPKDKEGNKAFSIAMHFQPYKKHLLFPIEDLPLLVGDCGCGDKIIAWRFSIWK